MDWLTTLVVELENGHGNGGGAGKAKIILMGHSCVVERRGEYGADGRDRMGGLLIADAARDIAANTREGDAIWPHVVAIMGEQSTWEWVNRADGLASFRYSGERAQTHVRNGLLTILDLKYLGLHPVSTQRSYSRMGRCC